MSVNKVMIQTIATAGGAGAGGSLGTDPEATGHREGDPVAAGWGDRDGIFFGDLTSLVMVNP